MTVDTDSSATPSLRRDSPRENEHCTDHGNARTSLSSLASSMTRYCFTSFSILKSDNKSVDSCSQLPPSERTALLASHCQTSNIEESVDHEAPEDNAFLSAFRREVKTLIRYALPVFGFVSLLHQFLGVFTKANEVRTCLSIVSSCPQWSPLDIYPPSHSLPSPSAL